MAITLENIAIRLENIAAIALLGWRPLLLGWEATAIRLKAMDN